ncbi:MAG TPA: serine/threonine-protein kinase [Gemmatimonadales bacterium]|nr:serine/threonine-protein kinase [Gemmatimonadales bacterium]
MLSAGPPRQDAPPAPAGLTEQLRLRLQEVVGDEYLIERLVGRGGYACVYAAREVALERPLAFKVLLPHAGTVAAERFRREARLGARVRHPHVMPIYLVRELGGLSFFVMPLVTGTNLRELLAREGRLPLDEVQRVLDESASGLAAAHQEGVIHRDVKPENILLEGSGRHVLIGDFGIARGLGADERRVTSDGTLVGTPDYMSPEQSRGEERIDRRTDIYALGVVGFEMVTGRLPFEAASWEGMLLKHIAEEAPRVERFRPDCPRGLGDVIARCLAKNPADRWGSMAELQEALARTSSVPRRFSRLLSLLPVIRRRTPRRSMVGRFRQLVLAFIATNAVLFLVDLRDGVLDFAPLLLLVLGFLLASQYGTLANAGFSWRDLFPRHRPEAPTLGPDPPGTVSLPTPGHRDRA